MGRRLAIAALAALGLLLLAAAVLVAFRTAVAEAVLAEVLARRGVAVGALEVAELGLDRARLTGLRLGEADELGARAVRVAYRPRALLQGRIDRVAVDGLSLALDLTGAGPPLGSLQPLLADTGDGAPGVLAVPEIALSEARLTLRSPLGDLEVALDAEAWPDEGGVVAGFAVFDARGAPGRLSGSGDFVRDPDGSLSGRVVIEDGALALPGAEVAALRGDGTYRLAPGLPPELDAELSAGRLALPGAAFEVARLSLRTEAARALVEATLAGAGWSLALDGSVADYLAAPAVDLAARAEAGVDAALWPLLALPGPAAGRVALRLEARGRLPPLAALAEAETPPAALPEAAALDLTARAEAQGLGYPERIDGLSGRLRLSGSLSAGTLAFATDEPAELVAAALDPAWLATLGLPAPLAALLEEGARATLRAEGTATAAALALDAGLELATPGGVAATAGTRAEVALAADLKPAEVTLEALELSAQAVPLPGLRLDRLEATGALAGPPAALAGTLDLTLAARDLERAGLHAAAVAARLPLELTLGAEAQRISLREAGELALRELRYGDALRLATPLVLTLDRAEVAARADAAGGQSLDYALEAATQPVTLVLARGAEAFGLELSPGALALEGTWSPAAPYRGTARLEATTLRLPAQALALEGLTAQVRLGGDDPPIAAEIPGATLRHLGEPALFVPLTAQAKVAGDGGSLAFTLEAAAPDGLAHLAAHGTYRPAAGRAEAEVTLDPLVFAPGGLQPAALSPALAGLREVRGTLGAEARLGWDAGAGLSGEADLGVTDLTLESDAARVEDLDLALRLAQLDPPRSPPAQRLTVARIDPGVPLSGIDLRFQVQPATPARLAVEDGAFTLFGGRFLLRDAILDPAAAEQRLPLRVEGLDLAELFRLLDIAGVTGDGKLSGRLPIALAGETVVIAGGRLAAEAPGHLRLRSAEAAQVLAGAGEDAELALRALGNFHYDELTLDIEKPAGANARVTLLLLGRNPDVLDGHPFRFNVNLETDAEKLIAAFGEAYGVSNQLLRRLFAPAR